MKTFNNLAFVVVILVINLFCILGPIASRQVRASIPKETCIHL